MITEDYVSFETAKMLEEKGFDETCRASYVYDKKEKKSYIHNHDSHLIDDYITNSFIKKYNDSDARYYAAPTLQMAAKWLRSKGIHVEVQALEEKPPFTSLMYHFCLYRRSVLNGSIHTTEFPYNKMSFFSYEEALEEGIEEACKLIANKQ